MLTIVTGHNLAKQIACHVDDDDDDDDNDLLLFICSRILLCCSRGLDQA